LINAIVPGSIKKFNAAPKMPFKAMENIGLFLAAVRALGIPDRDLFRTVDLFEGKDMAQVSFNLLALGRLAHKTAGYNGPNFGVKEVAATPRNFTPQQLLAASAEPTLLGQGSRGAIAAGSAGASANSRDVVRGTQ
jgi:hypothetical protein